MSAKSDPLARFALAALIAFFVPASVRAQDVDCDQPNEREVRSLRFEGNQTFDTDQLSAIVITTPSSFARRYFRVFGTKRCYPSDGLTQGRHESQGVLPDQRLLRRARRHRRNRGFRLGRARDVSHQRGATADPRLVDHHGSRFRRRPFGDSA
jgi:hypothetical protein